MILTKDNLLRFVQQQKYVLPTTIANEFDTTTMISSAALSELAKDKSLGITYLKLSTSPYYYDIEQPEALQELAEKHLEGNEYSVYQKLKEQQILPKNALSIPEQIAIEKIQDFAKKIELEWQEKQYTFWIWYLRDLNETKKQIQNYFSGSAEQQKSQPETKKKQEHTTTQTSTTHTNTNSPKTTNPSNNNNIIDNSSQTNHSTPTQSLNITPEKNQYELAIEQYLQKNNLYIENKQKSEKGILYNVKLSLNSFSIEIDCFYYHKKPSEAEIINFYTSSIKPKILFINQPPKKLYKLIQDLDNLEIINL